MEQKNNTGSLFSTLTELLRRWQDGTFKEIIDDWRWIFSYSRKYWKAIIFYVLLGVFSTTMGLVSSVASKYTIDIITGYQTDRLVTLIIIKIGRAHV